MATKTQKESRKPESAASAVSANSTLSANATVARNNVTVEDDWDHLTIANRFIFAKVMSDPENALPLIREILPDVDIQGIRIIEAESTHESLPGSKGVRYDIYINDVNGRGYVIEMQASDTDELPLRSRYYSSMMGPSVNLINNLSMSLISVPFIASAFQLFLLPIILEMLID